MNTVVILSTNGKEVLWFGMWFDYWKDRGVPLCFGVSKDWKPNVITEFKKLNPNCVTFPPNDPTPYLTADIDQLTFLSNQSISEITDILVSNLKNLCDR